MLKATFRPMVNKPDHKGYGFKASTFRAKWEQTLDLLEAELGALKATDVVIEVDAPAEQFRNDGSIKRTIQPRSPHIRVSFDCKHGHLSYTCSTFSGYEANLRAVALTLEQLRACDRYGAVKGGEQYKGWAALPQTPGQMAAPDAMPFREVVVELAGFAKGFDSTWQVRAENLTIGPAHALDRDKLVADAIKVAHPDRGGTAAKIERVLALRRRLDSLAHGG